jgi:arylsulfatase
MRASFDADPDGPTNKVTQYYEMFGHRGVWHRGWKAVTVHGPMSGAGAFQSDQWQLFHTEEDRAEARDLAAEQPDKLEELKAMWYAEAGKYDVLPLNSYLMSGEDAIEFISRQYHVAVPKTGRYTYYPGTLEVPEHSAANTHVSSWRILAEVETTADSQGVIFAQGSRFGGHSLYLLDSKLHYVYNFLGLTEQHFSTDAPAPGQHIFGVEFNREHVDEDHQPNGTTILHVDDQEVDRGPMRVMALQFSLCGEGLTVGYDGGDSVSPTYPNRFEFTNGTIKQVVFDVSDGTYHDIETYLASLMARD